MPPGPPEFCKKNSGLDALPWLPGGLEVRKEGPATWLTGTPKW